MKEGRSTWRRIGEGRNEHDARCLCGRMEEHGREGLQLQG